MEAGWLRPFHRLSVLPNRFVRGGAFDITVAYAKLDQEVLSLI